MGRGKESDRKAILNLIPFSLLEIDLMLVAGHAGDGGGRRVKAALAHGNWRWKRRTAVGQPIMTTKQFEKIKIPNLKDCSRSLLLIGSRPTISSSTLRGVSQ